MANKIIKKISSLDSNKPKVKRSRSSRKSKAKRKEVVPIDISSKRNISEEFKLYKDRIASRITSTLKKLEKETSKVDEKLEELGKKKQELDLKKKTIEPIISEVVEFQTDFEALIERLNDSEDELNHNISLYGVRKAELEDEIKSLEKIYNAKKKVLRNIENELKKIKNLTKSSLNAGPDTSGELLKAPEPKPELAESHPKEIVNQAKPQVKPQVQENKNQNFDVKDEVLDEDVNLDDFDKFSENLDGLLKSPEQEKFFDKIEPKEDELEKLFEESVDGKDDEKKDENKGSSLQSNNAQKSNNIPAQKNNEAISDLDKLLSQHGISKSPSTTSEEVDVKPKKKKGFFSKLFGKHDDFEVEEEITPENKNSQSKTQPKVASTQTPSPEPIVNSKDQTRDLNDELSNLLNKTKSLKNELSTLHNTPKESSVNSMNGKESKSETVKDENSTKSKDEVTVCPVCGTPRKPGAKYCHVCGYKFED